MSQGSSPYRIFGIDFGTNPEQRELIRLIREPAHRLPVVYCLGSAGTGKTFASLAASLSLVRAKGAKRGYKSVIYVREPVEIGHRLGYLKGKQEDKMAPYLGPLLDNYAHLMNFAKHDGEAIPNARSARKGKDGEDLLPEEYSRLPSDIVPLAPEFLRGRSFEDCIILVDEAQNMTLDELQTMVTRIGSNCKMVLIGSPNQIDIPGQTEAKNDFLLSYEILSPTNLVASVKLTAPMRSGFVTDFDRRFSDYKAAHPKEK